ncbi:hypothetical protein [Nocardioides sp. GXQ0305]|uniref:hypothetical protein n=1 Tax=Nocardioides sp. GXQ0305 TaxID=3423912 RepID=UPI003D7D0C5F
MPWRGVAVSGLVALGVAGGAVAFLQARERSCGSMSAGECVGAGLTEWLATVLVAYVAWAVALRVARTALPWLAPVAVVAGVSVFIVPLDPPLWASVVGVALLGAAWGAIPVPGGRKAAA